MSQKKLDKLVLQYGSTAAALLGVQAVKAQVDSVYYTDIQDVTLNANGAYYELNVDNDTSEFVDYRIVQLIDSADAATGVVIQAMGNAGNQAVGLSYANYNYPFKLNLRDVVGPDTVFRGINSTSYIGQLALEINDTTYPNDQFHGGVTDAFIGLRFKADYNDTIRNYYGWVRIDIAADLKSVTIKDYGYNAQYDEAILAGEGSPLSINELEAPKVWMLQKGQTLDIRLEDDILPGGSIKIHDMGGRELKELSFDTQAAQFPLEGLPKGIHFATLTYAKGKEQIRVVVY